MDRKVILEYLAPPSFLLKSHIPFRSAIIVGSMNSGKTSFTKAFIGKAVGYLLSTQGIDEKEIAFIHSYERNMSEITKTIISSLDLNGIKYMYLFNDDAPGSAAFSRMFLTRENRSEMQFYIMIRHRLERYGFTGILIVIHATQILNIIDKTFRSTSDLLLFKSYPIEPSDKKLIGMILGRSGMYALADLTFKLRMPRSINDYLSAIYSAVAKLIRIKRLVKAYDSNPERDSNRYKQILEKVNNVVIEPKPIEDEEKDKDIETSKLYNILERLLLTLRKNGLVMLHGNRVDVRIDGKLVTIPTEHLKQSTIEKLRSIKIYRRKQSVR